MPPAPRALTRPAIADPVDPPLASAATLRPPRSRKLWIAALAAGVCAAAVVSIATAPPGPGLDPDSMQYLGSAISLVKIGAYRVPTSSWQVADTTEPLTHFPPGFPTLLAAPIALGVSPIGAARLVLALAAFATWAGLVALIATNASIRTSVLTALALLCTPAMIDLHLAILSEPAFLAAFVAVLAALWAASRSDGMWPVLWVGLATALGIMLRYAGASLVLAAGCWMLVARRQHLPVGQRVARTVGALVPTVVVLGAWLRRSIQLEGVQGVRELGAYTNFGDIGRQTLQTIVWWVVPVGTGSWRYPIAILVIACTVALLRAAWPRLRSRAPFLALLIIVACTYTGFLLASRIFADPLIPFDERILSPLFLLAEITLGLAIAAWWPYGGRLARRTIAAIVFVWVAISAGVSVSHIVDALSDGNDFAGSDLRESPTIAWVRDSSGGLHRTLYTNWPVALYFQADRMSHDLPQTLDGLTLHRFRQRLERSNGVVVGFSARSPDVPPPDSIAALLGLKAIGRFSDGSVWELPGGE